MASVNAFNQDATVTDWVAAGESFDTSYERVRAVFGSEESLGLDGDPRLFVIHSDRVGKVAGYFSQVDQFPAVVETHSNEGQYLFISNSWSSGLASEYYKEVLAHEFQHMVNANVDPDEEGWLNEGFQHARTAAGRDARRQLVKGISRSTRSVPVALEQKFSRLWTVLSVSRLHVRTIGRGFYQGTRGGFRRRSNEQRADLEQIPLTAQWGYFICRRDQCGIL